MKSAFQISRNLTDLFVSLGEFFQCYYSEVVVLLISNDLLSGLFVCIDVSGLPIFFFKFR